MANVFKSSEKFHLDDSSLGKFQNVGLLCYLKMDSAADVFVYLFGNFSDQLSYETSENCNSFFNRGGSGTGRSVCRSNICDGPRRKNLHCKCLTGPIYASDSTRKVG